MLPVMLADPLWWVAARLRRILTSLLVLALAFGAHAHAQAGPAPVGGGPAAVGAPVGGSLSETVSLTAWSVPTPGVLPAASAPRTAASRAEAWPEIVTVAREVPPGRARVLGAELSHPRGSGESQPAEAVRIRSTLLAPGPAAVRAASAADERLTAAYQAGPPGQRAPPAY